MCVTSGVDGGKGATIFDVMDQKVTKDGMLRLNAINLSVDNTNAMIGCSNLISSHCKTKNQSIFISGFPYQLAHLAATAQNDSFTEIINSPVELAKKGGRPRTNCNRSYLNVFWTRI